MNQSVLWSGLSIKGLKFMLKTKRLLPKKNWTVEQTEILRISLEYLLGVVGLQLWCLIASRHIDKIVKDTF